MLLSGGRAGSSHLFRTKSRVWMPWSRGVRATSQAGAWGPQADAFRLRAGGLRSPGCWGGARRGNIPLDRGWALWQQLQALRLQMESLLPFLNWGHRMFGQLSSVAGLCAVCSRVTQSRPIALRETKFYHGNRLGSLGWHKVSQQAGTRIFRARSESKRQFDRSLGLKAAAAFSHCSRYHPSLMGLLLPRLVWEKGLREVK